ncbi:MAG: glycoside hydrolase family 127 protein [Pigmentiphaga sp.]|nr:glycoside hydrolase family 127 protein [Pigmentiphaga sp.]
MRINIIVLLFFIAGFLSAQNVNHYNTFLKPSEISIQGFLGDEIQSVEKGRLSMLPSWNNGKLIKMFSEDFRKNNKTNDWFGEHAGKWLYSTALAVERTNDKNLKELLFNTADELISYQDDDGYLGSYSPTQRISAPDYPMHAKSWDVWNLTYMTLGLLKVNEFFPNEKYLQVAKNIGELFLKTFGEDKEDITNYGTRHGLSSVIALEAIVELYKTTNDTRYLDFGSYILKRINERENLKLFTVLFANRPLELVGDGKIYQNIWNLYAIAKFYELKPKNETLEALNIAWEQIHSFNLNPAGGPWGGIGNHLECFNSRKFFSPYGLVETCSTMSWIHFNKQMLGLTGEAKFAEEIEKSTYNALLGAKFPNGVDWCYHSFTNGSRHAANFNDCCPSSGTLAMEELSTLFYSLRENGISCNLYGKSELNIALNSKDLIKLKQETNYPFDGKIKFTINSKKNLSFPIFLRIPEWANTASIKVNGLEMSDNKITANSFFKINRKWKNNDIIEIDFPFEFNTTKKLERVEAPQSQYNIFEVNWTAITRGPLVYSINGLINGTERETILNMDFDNLNTSLKEVKSSKFTNQTEYITPDSLILMPYYRADNREKTNWRLTWFLTDIK